VNCSASFPLCRAGPNATFSELRAQDSVGFKYRLGPTSLLPKEANQLLITHFGVALEYLVWVDATAAPPKVINCTKAKVHVPTNQTAWAHGFLGSLWTPGGTFNGDVPCTGVNSSSCQKWDFRSTFSESCLGKSYEGHEEQRWLLTPTDGEAPPSSNVSVMTFTNDIYRPTGMPSACGAGGHTAWWHDTWLTSSALVDASIFDVPADCPEAVGGHTALRKDWRGGSVPPTM